MTPIGSCVGERIMKPGRLAYAATKRPIKIVARRLVREAGSHHGQQLSSPLRSIWISIQPQAIGPKASYITDASLTVDGGTKA